MDVRCKLMDGVGSQISFGGSAEVRIQVQGIVPPDWIDRLGGLSVEASGGKESNPIAVLTGRIADQSALMGVLTTLHDLHLPLISIQLLEASPSAEEQFKEGSERRERR
jgi:hypothetical protein